MLQRAARCGASAGGRYRERARGAARGRSGKGLPLFAGAFEHFAGEKPPVRQPRVPGLPWMPPFQEPVFKRSIAGRVGGGSWGRFSARGAGRSVPPGPGAAADAVSGEQSAVVGDAGALPQPPMKCGRAAFLWPQFVLVASRC